MSRGADCLLATGFLIGAVVILVTSILTGAVLASKDGVKQFRGILAEFFAAPLGFFREVVDGSRGFYTDPLTYMLEIGSGGKEGQGAPIAWWDCNAELPCLVNRLSVRTLVWAEAWEKIRYAIEDSEQPEGLQRTGNWSYAMVWDDRSGECLLHGSTLCEDVLSLVHGVGLSGRLLAVKISALQPGTQLHPHVGPRRDRLRVMLPLVVPEDTVQTGVRSLGIHVGNRSEELVLGEPLCFNDAVRHTAWNHRSAPRVALLIDLLHPSLSKTPLCSGEAPAAGPRLCRAACDALRARKKTCGAPPWENKREHCIDKCKFEITWGQRYVSCLESEANCWQSCETLKSSRAALLPLSVTANVEAPGWKQWIYYRLLNAFIYRLSDFLLGIEWEPSYY